MKRQRKRKRPASSKKRRRFIYSNASIFFLFLIVIFLGYQLFGLVEKRNISREKLNKAKEELREFQEAEVQLREQILELDTDEGRERTIRQRFNVTKENEGVIYVIEEGGTQQEEYGFFEEVEDETEKSFLNGLRSWLPF